jgi:transcriptional regulator with XRE-family HTH domain
MSQAGTQRAGKGKSPGPGPPTELDHGSTRLGTYLRKLREGYGYTLRKVEEHAVSMGEAIDNSQLSRFEKGKAVPSFDKLRALARVFNVPVQAFSDVLDLEEYQQLKPVTDNFGTLLKDGAELIARGEPGRAYVTYERALEVAESIGEPRKRADMIAESRWRMACALKALGKLYMAEHELREILKDRERLAPKPRLRSLLQLGYLYRELGDLYLASVLVRECLVLAREQGDLATQAGVLNSLGNILLDGSRPAEAADSYREALSILDKLEGYLEMKTMVMTNLGGSLVTTDQHEQGLALLDSARTQAQQNGFRRIAALAVTWMAEAWRRHGEPDRARELLGEADALASRPEGCFYDILFLSAYHRWKMVREESNSTGEKIAFGRLRHLRSLLQRRFPEVDEFDRHVERTRR